MVNASNLKAASEALAAAQRGDYQASLDACIEVLGSRPPAAGQARDADLELHFLACSALANLRRFSEASAYLDNLRPHADLFADFVALRAACRHGEGRYAEALDLADKLPEGFAYSPMWAPTLLSIRFTCGEIGAHLQRIDFWRILREAPDCAAGFICQWPYAAATTNEEYLDRTRAFHRSEIERLGLETLPRPPLAPLQGRRLKIGYLTSATQAQGFAAILSGMLAEHDRARYDVHVFDVAWRGPSALRTASQA
ncbi:MAG: hypothetical protein JNM26_09920, partial [Ideonella sp.]|nr:hypothetical protein [Ideonella sp.]